MKACLSYALCDMEALLKNQLVQGELVYHCKLKLLCKR